MLKYCRVIKILLRDFDICMYVQIDYVKFLCFSNVLSFIV